MSGVSANIIPARGLKKLVFTSAFDIAGCFRQHNPRKGTENGWNTVGRTQLSGCVSANIIPARGLKTDRTLPIRVLPANGSFRQHNPRKGTEKSFARLIVQIDEKFPPT